MIIVQVVLFLLSVAPSLVSLYASPTQASDMKQTVQQVKQALERLAFFRAEATRLQEQENSEMEFCNAVSHLSLSSSGSSHSAAAIACTGSDSMDMDITGINAFAGSMAANQFDNSNGQRPKHLCSVDEITFRFSNFEILTFNSICDQINVIAALYRHGHSPIASISIRKNFLFEELYSKPQDPDPIRNLLRKILAYECYLKFIVETLASSQAESSFGY